MKDRDKVRQRAKRAITRMARNDESLASASRREQVDPRTVQRYVGRDLRKLPTGRYQVKQSDLRLRRMLIPTPVGTKTVKVYGSHQASQIGRYMSAVGKYLRTGDTKALAEFEGHHIAGQPLITDSEVLDSLAQAGTLHLDEIYAPGSSS